MGPHNVGRRLFPPTRVALLPTTSRKARAVFPPAPSAVRNLSRCYRSLRSNTAHPVRDWIRAAQFSMCTPAPIGNSTALPTMSQAGPVESPPSSREKPRDAATAMRPVDRAAGCATAKYTHVIGFGW